MITPNHTTLHHSLSNNSTLSATPAPSQTHPRSLFLTTLVVVNEQIVNKCMRQKKLFFPQQNRANRNTNSVQPSNRPFPRGLKTHLRIFNNQAIYPFDRWSGLFICCLANKAQEVVWVSWTRYDVIGRNG